MVISRTDTFKNSDDPDDPMSPLGYPDDVIPVLKSVNA